MADRLLPNCDFHLEDAIALAYEVKANRKKGTGYSRFAILDPAYSKEKYEEEGRRGKIEVTNDVIVLSEAKYLEEEATPRSTPYYLFWRK